MFPAIDEDSINDLTKSDSFLLDRTNTRRLNIDMMDVLDMLYSFILYRRREPSCLAGVALLRRSHRGLESGFPFKHPDPDPHPLPLHTCYPLPVTLPPTLSLLKHSFLHPSSSKLAYVCYVCLDERLNG
jgi:hypothetical protein